MSRYNVIKTATDAYIKRNGRREITGPILNSVLNAIIDSLGKFYQFVGVATPSTNPGSPDQNVAFVAATAGTYANMGGVVLASGEMAVIKWDGTWVKETILILPEGSESYFIRGTIDFNQNPTVVTITSGTYAEALAAYNAGTPVYAALTEGNGAVDIYPLAQVISPFLVFIGIGADSVLAVGIQSDGTIMVANSALVHPSDLAPVATSGNYNDLDNKPTIPAAQVQSDWNEADNTDPSYIKNKPTIPTVPDISTDIVADRASDTKTASPKAVFDASAKYGVISQTQTWTQAADGGYDYTMSNLVWGAIPQANIDLFESAGAVFNESTGYFELNGLTDISYAEMKRIYDKGHILQGPSTWQHSNQAAIERTTLPAVSETSYLAGSGSFLNFANAARFETVVFHSTTGYSESSGILVAATNYAFSNCIYLKSIQVIRLGTSTMTKCFNNCYSLEDARLYGLSVDVDFSQSARLKAESVEYTINNAGTAAITITLHATAYARAMADTDVQTALAAHTNVTLASA